MLYSLIELLGKGRRHFIARLYRIDHIEREMHITLTAWTDGRSIRCEEHECDTTAAPEHMIHALTLGVTGHDILADDKHRGLHFAWLPVSRDKELLGCIEIGTTRPLPSTLMTLINGMRGLYANYLSLLRYSQVDTLTQLLNRKTFDDSLQHLLSAAAGKSLRQHPADRRVQPGQPANWLAVMDIDHFKRVNDAFGHLFGDEVLILAANIMRKVFRRKDKLFRFGGEEFVILLRDSSEDHALKVFERFRRTMEQHEFPQLGHVTISIGVTKVQAFDNPTTLLGRADEALYYAKNHGRNQVQFYDQLEANGNISNASVVHTEAEMF